MRRARATSSTSPPGATAVRASIGRSRCSATGARRSSAAPTALPCRTACAPAFCCPGADGTSGASGTHIEGFVFDGRGISADNLEPLGVAIIATFASHVRVERNVILGTVQGITNTAGDSWLIVHNVIRDLTVFDCTGALCGGGDGIVIQIARDPIAVPGGPEAAGNRPKDNVVVGNVIEGAIPDGFEAFDMAGVFVFAADRTVVARNRLSLPDNPNADAEGIGVLVDNSCCGLPAIVPGRATRSSRSTTAATASARSRSTAPAARTRRGWCCSATPAP